MRLIIDMLLVVGGLELAPGGGGKPRPWSGGWELAPGGGGKPGPWLGGCQRGVRGSACSGVGAMVSDGALHDAV